MNRLEGVKRALIVNSPYAELIVNGSKTWEMRTRKTNIRGTVGIIEAGTGLIIGKVDIVDSFDKVDFDEFINNSGKHWITDREIVGARGFKYRYPWVLENAVEFDEPIKYNHPQGAQSWVKLDNNGVILWAFSNT